MINGAVSFGQVCAVLVIGYGFGGFLHDQPGALWILILGIVLFLFFLVVWVRSLLLAPEETDPNLRHRKQVMAVRLVGLWLFSFATSFAMIPMYYWLNGSGGHVHGAAPASLLDATPLSQEDDVAIFMVTDVNTDKLPVRFQVHPAVVTARPGGSYEVEVSVYNPLDTLQTFTLAAKSTPAEVSPFLHYALIGDAVTVEVMPKNTETFTYALHVAEEMPASLGNVTVAHFLYGKQAPENWKKMMAGWPNNK